MSVSCFSFPDAVGGQEGNHPCEKVMSNQDAFRRRKTLELRECKENTGSLEQRESVDILISVEL